MFELFVARRYLRAKRKQVVISVITVISVIGVAAGVMALVIALAINNGFRSTLQRDLLAATAPVSILDQSGAGIVRWEQMAASLKRLPHVISAAPSLFESGLLRGPINSTGAQIKGIPVGTGAPVPDMLLHLKSGSIDALRTHKGELPGIVLGWRMAQTLGAVEGKPVTLIIPTGELTPFGPRSSEVRLLVAGTFESGFYDADANWAFMSLEEEQKAFDVGDVVNSIELHLDDIYNSTQVAAAAKAIVGHDLEATTWQEQNRAIMNALRNERWVTVITISLIMLVAALNILITLVMMVMEKHRDIAILMSMGARIQQVRRIFVLEGALIGAFGTSIGLTVGYTVCYLANRFRWLKLDEQIYSVAYVPFDARWRDALWIAAFALVISLVATLYPARSAARIAPVEALRYE
jgi:lipoprotein-releasing system permease protein